MDAIGSDHVKKGVNRICKQWKKERRCKLGINECKNLKQSCQILHCLLIVMQTICQH